MLGNWPRHELPQLTDATCDVTSPATRRYNCIAWAAQQDDRWWWPDPLEIYYWPPEVPREATMQAFIAAYKTLGYSTGTDQSFDERLDKIAIFGVDYDGLVRPTHAAFQLRSGAWTSKLGECEDVTHLFVEDVSGPLYGRPVMFMYRLRS